MPSPLDAAVRHPVRRQLLRALLMGDELTLHQMVRMSGLSSPAAAYHLRILADADAVARVDPKAAEPAYEANLDALPAWVRQSVEAGGEL